MIDVAAAVKFVGTALCHKGDLCAGVTAIFGLILSCQYFEFRHGIDADSYVLAVVSPRIYITDTVNRELIAGATVAIDEYICETTHATNRKIGGTDDAGNQFRHIEGVSAI